MRIVFMGTPDFAVPSLERLVEAGYRPVAVVTGPDRPRGRGQQMSPTPVKKAARRLEIDRILQPESVKDPSFTAAVRQLRPDVIVVVAFRILPPEVFEAASLGAFNLHGSLLPKYRGAAPINHAILQGESETGVTTFFLRSDVDTGDVILQEQMPIGSNETAGEVHDRMMEVGAEAVVATVRLIESGSVETERQDDSEATPAPKIHREDCRIAWDRPAPQVHNQIRGLSPFPGAWTMHGETMHGETMIKIYRSRLPYNEDLEGIVEANRSAVGSGNSAPGRVLEAGERLVVACGNGAVEVTEVQQEGKRRLAAADFLRGYELPVGAILE